MPEFGSARIDDSRGLAVAQLVAGQQRLVGRGGATTEAEVGGAGGDGLQGRGVVRERADPLDVDPLVLERALEDAAGLGYRDRAVGEPYLLAPAGLRRVVAARCERG